jgi:hypothetical protein
MLLGSAIYDFNFDGRGKWHYKKSKPHEENANIDVVLLNGFY